MTRGRDMRNMRTCVRSRVVKTIIKYCCKRVVKIFLYTFRSARGATNYGFSDLWICGRARRPAAGRSMRFMDPSRFECHDTTCMDVIRLSLNGR